MRMKLSENPRPDSIILSVRNSESTAAIPRGTPVILNLSSAAQPTTAADGFGAGYEDGLQVVLPATAGGNVSFFQYGVATDIIANGQLGEALIFGVSSYALVVRATRSASSASWSSSASSSSAGGFLLSIGSADNAFNTFAASSQSASATTGGFDPQRNPPQAIMLDSFAVFSASATATSDTRTSVLIGYRCFIRML